MAALVFTIPLLFMVKEAAWGIYHLVSANVYILILLFRIFSIARSLEQRIPGRERIKSVSEIDITRIENGLE